MNDGQTAYMIWTASVEPVVSTRLGGEKLAEDRGACCSGGTGVVNSYGSTDGRDPAGRGETPPPGGRETPDDDCGAWPHGSSRVRSKPLLAADTATAVPVPDAAAVNALGSASLGSASAH